MAFDENAIRVLIVDDNRITLENVARLLDFEASIQVVGGASDGREGVRKAKELGPDVILMDINMPDMDGIEACRQIGQSSPRSRVMMMSVQGDTAYLKQAMNAGAREFLIKPFEYDELIHAIQRVYEADPTPAELAALATASAKEAAGQPGPGQGVERGLVIAVFAPKGGVGCSTIAANLAVALCGGREADVLLVDCDLYFGDLDVLLDLQPVHRMVDVLQKFDPDDLELMQRMLTSHDSGVQLLAAPSRPELAELVQPDLLLPMLNTLRLAHDYIVLDLGARYNNLTQQLLDLADRIVLLVTPEVTAIKNTNLFLTTPGMRGSPPEKVIPLLNKYNSSWGITPEAVGNAIGQVVKLVVPADGEATTAASNNGRPVLLDSPRSSMAKSLLALEKLVPDSAQLADELAELARQKREEPPPPIVSQRTPAQEWGPAAGPAGREERRGCARWLPFLGGLRPGGE